MKSISPQGQEISEKLHAFLPRQKHLIAQRLQEETDPEKIDQYRKLQLFVSGKGWSGKINGIFRLAAFVEHEKQRPLHNHLELLRELTARLDDKGWITRIDYNEAAQIKSDYSEVFSHATRRATGKAMPVPGRLLDAHAILNGNMESLDDWLRTPDSREFLNLEARLEKLILDNQAKTVEYILAKVQELSFYPRSILQSKIDKIANRMKQEKSVPFFTTLALHEVGPALEVSLELSKKYNLDISNMIGLNDIAALDIAPERVNRDSFHSIRDFFAYEITNIPDLNRASMLMTLLYPDYDDFISFMKTHASYDPHSQSLCLKLLTNVERFKFHDLDYQGWGKALLTGQPGYLFYFYSAQFLPEIPSNAKGDTYIQRNDSYLYEDIAEVNSLLSDEQLEKFRALKVAKDLIRTREFKNRCIKALNGKTLIDRARFLPELEIAGETFDKPDFRFARVKYDDERYFLVGRLTGNCEYLGGEWEAPIMESWLERTSTYYAIYDPNGKIIAHTWFRRDIDGNLIFDGFGKSRTKKDITESTLIKIRDAAEKACGEKILIGESQDFPGMKVDINNIKPEEYEDGSRKIIRRDEIWSAEKAIENSGPVALTIADDSGLLKEKGLDHLRKLPPSPKAP